MSTQLVKIRAIDALLPSVLINLAKTNEKEMKVIALLVLNLCKELIQYAEKKQPKGFDGFPGNGMCQGLMMLLPDLLEKPQVGKELAELAKKVAFLREALQKRQNQQDCSCSDFFEKEIGSLEISRDIHYLLDCRLLTITRGIKYVEPNGIVISMTDHGLLSKLSAQFHTIENRGTGKNYREQITDNASTRLSAETMVRLQGYTDQIKVSSTHKRMLGQTVELRSKEFPTKTFGCQFFTVQLAFLRLLERKTPVVIKTIVPKGSSSGFIFFRAHENDFVFQDQTEAKKMEKTSYIAVIQAIVPSADRLLTKVKEIGFMELLLRLTALEPHYHHTISEKIKDREALQVIEEHEKKAAESGCDKSLLHIHHMYSTTLQEEIK